MVGDDYRMLANPQLSTGQVAGKLIARSKTSYHYYYVLYERCSGLKAADVYSHFGN